MAQPPFRNLRRGAWTNGFTSASRVVALTPPTKALTQQSLSHGSAIAWLKLHARPSACSHAWMAPPAAVETTETMFDSKQSAVTILPGYFFHVHGSVGSARGLPHSVS